MQNRVKLNVIAPDEGCKRAERLNVLALPGGRLTRTLHHAAPVPVLAPLTLCGASMSLMCRDYRKEAAGFGVLVRLRGCSSSSGASTSVKGAGWQVCRKLQSERDNCKVWVP